MGAEMKPCVCGSGRYVGCGVCSPKSSQDCGCDSCKVGPEHLCGLHCDGQDGKGCWKRNVGAVMVSSGTMEPARLLTSRETSVLATRLFIPGALVALRDVGHRLAIRFSRDEVDDVLQIIEEALEREWMR